MFKTVVFETGSFEIAQWKAVTWLIPDVQRESLFPTFYRVLQVFSDETSRYIPWGKIVVQIYIDS